jgi:hypothetical protein
VISGGVGGGGIMFCMDEDKRNYWQVADNGASIDPDIHFDTDDSITNATDVVAVAVAEWDAPEYIHSDKTPLWYVLACVLAAAFMVLAVVVFHSWTFAALVLVMAVSVVVYARRRPGIARYSLDTSTLVVNDKPMALDEFRAYSIGKDADMYYVALVSHKRFMPMVFAYFPEEKGDDIVEILADVLPVEPIHRNMIDMVSGWLRL